MNTELYDLRRRVAHQRRELRRLNRHVEAIRRYWLGFEHGVAQNMTSTLRGKMQRAFGFDAVKRAEDAP